MANVQLLDTKGVDEALQGGDVDVFRYQLNRLGYTLILAIGGLMLAGAGFIWWQYGFSENLWTAIFAGLVAGGLGLSVHAAYWYAFAGTHFVGVTDDKLLVGREEKAWSIDWSVLDVDALGLQRMNATAAKGMLEVRVGGEEIKIYLYNPYVFLEDIQALMSSLLERLQSQQQAGNEASDEQDVVVSDS
jgi:hypothetical protein